MQWLEIKIDTVHEKIDELCAKLENLGIEGLVIDDEEEYSKFLDNNRQYWDYVDEELLKSLRGLCRIKFYLEDSEDGRRQLDRICLSLPEEKVTVNHVKDEDWENNWKEFYKPVPVGNKLLIVPKWEEIPENGNRKILKLDPGLIFGTGTHATTQMCLCALEDCAGKGKKVLDLGCGSGILAIAAIILGADESFGCDIDPKAPDVAAENAALNGINSDKFKVYAGDILSDIHLKSKIEKEKYDIVLANIVADVIISLSVYVKTWMKDDGVFICSGIIYGREDEVEKALTDAGMNIMNKYSSGGWNCYKCCKNA